MSILWSFVLLNFTFSLLKHCFLFICSPHWSTKTRLITKIKSCRCTLREPHLQGWSSLSQVKVTITGTCRSNTNNISYFCYWWLPTCTTDPQLCPEQSLYTYILSEGSAPATTLHNWINRATSNHISTLGSKQPGLWKDEQCPLLKLTVFIYGRLMCFAYVIVVVIWKAQNESNDSFLARSVFDSSQNNNITVIIDSI